MNHTDLQIEAYNAAAAKATAATAAGGIGGAVLFGLTANEIAAFGGLFIAVIGLLVNIWFRWQSLRIERIRAGLE